MKAIRRLAKKRVSLAGIAKLLAYCALLAWMWNIYTLADLANTKANYLHRTLRSLVIEQAVPDGK